MKRDVELMRRVLMAIEEHHDPFSNEVFNKDWLPDLAALADGQRRLTAELARINMHIRVLSDAGFLIIHEMQRDNIIARITSRGYDFLDLVRSPRMWGRMLEIVENAEGYTLDVLMRIAEETVEQEIRLRQPR